MVQWKPLNPDEVDNTRDAHRGRVSYPLLKSFLESGESVAELDRTGLQQSLQGLNSCLTAYIKSHNLPIRIRMRRGEIIAIRTDIGDNGQPIEENNNIDSIPQKKFVPGKAEEHLTDAPPVNAAEVSARFGIEKNLATK